MRLFSAYPCRLGSRRCRRRKAAHILLSRVRRTLDLMRAGSGPNGGGTQVKMTTRERILTEIMATEKDYADDMELMVEVRTRGLVGVGFFASQSPALLCPARDFLGAFPLSLTAQALHEAA